jgi:hypothetical protein
VSRGATALAVLAAHPLVAIVVGATEHGSVPVEAAVMALLPGLLFAAWIYEYRNARFPRTPTMLGAVDAVAVGALLGGSGGEGTDPDAGLALLFVPLLGALFFLVSVVALRALRDD